MIAWPSDVRAFVATGATDMRKGMNGLALQIQEGLKRDPHAGDVFIFRGRRGDLVKIVWHDGLGLSLYAKRLEQGAFQWPKITDGVMRMTAVQLAALVAGMEWTRVVSPRRTQTPKEVS